MNKKAEATKANLYKELGVTYDLPAYKSHAITIDSLMRLKSESDKYYCTYVARKQSLRPLACCFSVCELHTVADFLCYKYMRRHLFCDTYADKRWYQRLIKSLSETTYEYLFLGKNFVADDNDMKIDAPLTGFLPKPKFKENGGVYTGCIVPPDRQQQNEEAFVAKKRTVEKNLKKIKKVKQKKTGLTTTLQKHMTHLETQRKSFETEFSDLRRREDELAATYKELSNNCHVRVNLIKQRIQAPELLTMFNEELASIKALEAQFRTQTMDFKSFAAAQGMVDSYDGTCREMIENLCNTDTVKEFLKKKSKKINTPYETAYLDQVRRRIFEALQCDTPYKKTNMIAEVYHKYLTEEKNQNTVKALQEKVFHNNESGYEQFIWSNGATICRQVVSSDQLVMGLLGYYRNMPDNHKTNDNIHFFLALQDQIIDNPMINWQLTDINECIKLTTQPATLVKATMVIAKKLITSIFEQDAYNQSTVFEKLYDISSMMLTISTVFLVAPAMYGGVPHLYQKLISFIPTTRNHIHHTRQLMKYIKELITQWYQAEAPHFVDQLTKAEFVTATPDKLLLFANVLLISGQASTPQQYMDILASTIKELGDRLKRELIWQKYLGILVPGKETWYMNLFVPKSPILRQLKHMHTGDHAMWKRYIQALGFSYIFSFFLDTREDILKATAIYQFGRSCTYFALSPQKFTDEILSRYLNSSSKEEKVNTVKIVFENLTLHCQKIWKESNNGDCKEYSQNDVNNEMSCGNFFLLPLLFAHKNHQIAANVYKDMEKLFPRVGGTLSRVLNFVTNNTYWLGKAQQSNENIAYKIDALYMLGGS